MVMCVSITADVMLMRSVLTITERQYVHANRDLASRDFGVYPQVTISTINHVNKTK